MHSLGHTAVAAALLCVTTLLCGQATGQAGRKADWPAYGGQPAGDHYSALKQINRRNVKGLELAWQFDTGEHGPMQTNPLAVDGVLYGATPSQKIFALEAATGKLLWKFDSGITGTQPMRGLSWWQDGEKRRVLTGVMNYLYELDAATGKPVEAFGEHGRIDLRENLGEPREQATVALTTPGTVYGDLIIVGFRAPEVHPAPRGDIRAYDLHTGQLRWSFHTIPRPGEPGYETWPQDAWKNAGAANNWAGMTLDAKRGILFVPTGSAVDDFYGADRVGNDLYANCLLALEANTGKLLWYFQGVHHDIWDRDFPAPPVLLTVRRDGRSVDAVAATSKQGFVYLFDRVSGKPLFPIEERAYPQTDVPGESSAATQPLPVMPAPFARQQLTAEMLTDRTPEAHAWALQEFQSLRSEGQFIPLNARNQTVVMPSFDGGAEWGGAAADVSRGVLFVNSIDIASTGGLAKSVPFRGAGAATYISQCAVCHGSERKGSPPEFPSLTDVTARLSTEQIAATIHGGRGRMPSFPNLQGARLEAVLAYLRTGEDKAGPNTGPDNGPDGAPVAVHSGARGMAGEDKAGATSYAAHCAICHGADTAGIQPGFPSLVGVGQRLQTQQIRNLVLQGKGRMPAFHHIGDGELAALLRYLGADAATPPPAKELQGATTQAARYTFTGYRKFMDPDGYPAVAPPWGTLNAIDLNTGKYLWKIPFGEYPELAAKGMRNTGTENYGGPVVTAGGLVFIAATIFDRKMHAYNSRTGQLLWEYQMPFGGLATPATYMAGGRQFVAIAAGGGKDPHHPTGGLYLAFALPKSAKQK